MFVNIGGLQKTDHVFHVTEITLNLKFSLVILEVCQFFILKYYMVNPIAFPCSNQLYSLEHLIKWFRDTQKKQSQNLRLFPVEVSRYTFL